MRPNQPRLMRSALTRVTRVSTAAAAIALASLGMVGCDAESDAKVQASLQEAIDFRGVGSVEADEQARKKLGELSQNAGASPTMKAQLAAMRGQMDIDAAQKLMRDIDRSELELSRVAFDLGQLAAQLDAGSVMVAGFSKFDPSSAQSAIAQQIKDAQGSPEKLTWEFQSLQMPTIEAVKQSIAKLEGDLAKLNEQVQSLTTQRDAVMKDAEAAAQSADSQKGQAGLEEFKRATTLRKNAGELFIQIDKTNAEMVPLQRDLAVAQGQIKVLEDIVKQLQVQQTALDTGWKSMQEQIAVQKQLAQKIVGAEGATKTESGMSGASVAEKAAEINVIADELKSQRGKAQAALDSAVKQFDDAYKAANDVFTSLGAMISAIPDPNRADAKSFRTAQEIVNPQMYQLRQASAQRLMGALYASEGMSLMNRLSLQAAVVPIIERAGATVPSILQPGNLSKDATAALGQADEWYKNADEALNNVREGTSPKETKDAATVEQILTNYGWAQVLKASGDSKGAQEKLEKAIALRDGAAEQNIKLPALPAELGATPSKAPPATQEAPATAPTAPAAPAPPTDTPEEAEVRVVVNKYLDAMAANDQEAIKAVVHIEPGQEADFEQQLKLLTDLAKLKEVVTAKMGAEAGNAIGAIDNPGNVLRTLKITITGDDASVEVPGAGPQKAAVRQDGQWKLFFGPAESDIVKAQRAASAKLGEALPQIIADVESGTIADMQALQARLAQAVQPG